MIEANSVCLTELAKDRSEEILRRNLSDKGLVASIDVYQQVWARDSVITLLGGAVAKDPEMLAALRLSMSTLGEGQDRFGQIPYLIHISDGRRQFGSVDANPWFVIGSCYYAEQSGDLEWLHARRHRIVAALDWCESRDFNKAGLMDSLECDDWADLLCNRGKVLFPNVLYFHALEMAARTLENSCPDESRRFRDRREVVRRAIQDTFWVAAPGTFKDESHYQTRAHMSITLRSRPYFMPWVTVYDYGDRFDSAGNLLAVMTGAANSEQAEKILNFIEQAGLNRPYPVRVLYPSIQQNEKDWREFYRVWGCNLPDQYLNGGIWPWVGGFYVAALAKMGRRDEAGRELLKLAEALRLGREEWECNEWMHGRSGVPMGAKYQAWSAGMYLYAAHAVEAGETPGFRT